MTWIIENEAFAGGDILLPALKSLGKDYILWDDNYWKTEEYLNFPKESIFHGSLGNAEKIRKLCYFSPGSICNEVGFKYSQSYEVLKDYLLNQEVIFTTISEVINNPSITKKLKTDKIFARPDSYLKEFSGRILPSQNLTPAHFDYGFYHDDINLQIVLAPFKPIEKEYRFICVGNKIVTGCEYIADGRKAGRTVIPEDNEPAFIFAQKIADKEKIREIAYVIDVCFSDSKYYLVEMNPFSGADLYHCDAKIIIESIEEHIRKEKERDAFEESLKIEDVWHEDHRFENQILSRCHGACFTYIMFEDGLYKVEVYLDCGTLDMAAWKSFTSLEEAKEFSEKRMLRLDS